MQRLVLAGMCPWCERGPFKVLARHTEAAHGIDRRELRQAVGLPWGVSICAPEVSERRRELNGQPERIERIARLRGGAGPREVSPAGREVLRANGAAVPLRPGRKRTITEETRARIRADVQAGASQTEVAARYGIAESTVSRILWGRTPRTGN